nr:protein ZINC INDUCED FACILITATOR-LIKE 1-like isoform X1 [Ipomoea batatas]
MAESGGEVRSCLLKSEEEEWEFCAGCNIERMKRSNAGIPFKHLFFVGVITLCAALPISSLFPFLYFMIKDFNVAEKEEDIGFYAGFVGSSYMVGRALTSLLWGVVADRWGRRPVVLFGTAAVLVELGFQFCSVFLLDKNYSYSDNL